MIVYIYSLKSHWYLYRESRCKMIHGWKMEHRVPRKSMLGVDLLLGPRDFGYCPVRRDTSRSDM